MDSGSVGRNPKPKVRIVAKAVIVGSVIISIAVMVWFGFISVAVIGVPRIIVMVSVQPLVSVNTLIVTSVGLFVDLTATRAIVVVPCLRRRPPSDQRHCQKNG
jgi:hypothetical protein